MPWGETPFGGQWSGRYLAFYALALTAFGFGLERLESKLVLHQVMQGILRSVLPLGLAISILATVRIAQSSPLMPDWLVELRPGRAWSVGLTGLAMSWALMAVGLKHFGWSTVSNRETALQREEHPARLIG